MEKYIFGNLKDWGIVLEKLEELSKNKNLGNHQEELIRLLRFNDNWRLREAAIESLHAIEAPSFDLIREVFRLVMRKDLYCEARILATDGLEKLFINLFQGKKVDVEKTIPLASEIIDGMERSLASPQPPIFGACDVVNPAAISIEGTPISGMPILMAHEAEKIIICNYDEKPGYSGVENPLYNNKKTILMLGDAKSTASDLIEILRSSHKYSDLRDRNCSEG